MAEEMMNVLYEDNHLLCVEKPANVPVCEDESRDYDLLSMAKDYIREKYSKPGNVWLGLVHRLDRPVGGVVVFARTSKAASRLSESVRTHKLGKEYYAVLDGVMDQPEGTLTDYLKKNPKTNMTSVCNAAEGKKSTLHYQVVAVRSRRTLVRVRLETGRSHQIRVQFASRGLPLVNDQRYHPHPSRGPIALYACRLLIPHPVKDEVINVYHAPPACDPWLMFEDCYDSE